MQMHVYMLPRTFDTNVLEPGTTWQQEGRGQDMEE